MSPGALLSDCPVMSREEAQRLDGRWRRMLKVRLAVPRTS
jgi:hypothetical protein